MRELKRLILNIQFMTRIPIPIIIDVKEGDFSKGTIYFPPIGILIGLILSAFYYLARNIFPREIVVTFIVALSYTLIGALHIDGFADTFDGLFSNKTKERMLEIMRDSRLGTNGVLATIFLVLLKILFLSKIDANIIIPTLIVMPMLGRFGILIAAFTSKSARGGEGLGGFIIGKVKLREFIIGLIFVLIAGYFLMQYLLFLKILIISMAASYMTTKYICLRIGGMTGDTLGAVNEFTELIVLISIFLLK